uniref:Uncharacterized protein n=1 Tax=Anguilla anguilla TaxID=7936 RepID=A0A0E9SSC7_ANGAN
MMLLRQGEMGFFFYLFYRLQCGEARCHTSCRLAAGPAILGEP